MSSRASRRGRLFILSAPSGTGKTTVAERLVARAAGVRRSISYTSRRARVGETDGVHYHFVTRERFEAMIAGNQFLEWADVFGHLYGTSLVDTERVLAAGDDLLLVIDVQGGRHVKRQGVPAVSVFLLPPSLAVLESRLRGRDRDSPDAIRTRLEVAREEIRAYSEYDYVLVNDEVDRCVERLSCIIVAERCRLAGMAAAAEDIAGGFPAPGA
ncbi:MAG: guanylate kinase [Acidobacteriota bacterium]